MNRTIVLVIAALLVSSVAWAQADQPAPAVEPEQPTMSPAPAPPPPPAPRPARHAVDEESPGRSVPPAAAPVAPAAPDHSPVVRAQGGNVGFYFKFGGLATLDHNNTTRTVDALAFTQVGLKLVVSEHLMVPIYFGTGLQHSKAEDCPTPNTCDTHTSTDVGIEAGFGLEYHFRIWRRISPFIGAGIGVGYVNPSGANNWNVGVGFGPILGVEYYIADRLSLTAQYMLTFQVGYQKSEVMGDQVKTTTFDYRTQAGGALVVTYYF
jgi:opacity protein-like surface antigen